MISEFLHGVAVLFLVVLGTVAALLFFFLAGLFSILIAAVSLPLSLVRTRAPKSATE